MLAWWGNAASKPAQSDASKAQLEVGGYLQSKFRNAEVLEPMGMVDNLYRRWAGKNASAMGYSLHAQTVSGKVVAWSKFVRYTQQSLALGGGALLVIQGDLLEAHPMRERAPVGEVPQGEMVIKDVVASAPGRETPIIKGVTALMPKGTCTVVLGASGSGKSTLARVLLGIWPHTSGEVLLDGKPVSRWDRMELGPHIGYLPQDIELFDGTIADNIARSGQVDSDKVIAAAEAAGLHGMILRFPKGYDTPMGEAGGLLSGGQRQRVGLARALYGEPALVVLDEPNANLDDEGEAALVRAVQGLKEKGKTVVLISHRPGIVSVADRLLILHEGGVQASGPRDGVLDALKKQREAANAANAVPVTNAAPSVQAANEPTQS